MQKVGLAAFIEGFFGISVGTQEALLSLLSLSNKEAPLSRFAIIAFARSKGGGRREERKRIGRKRACRPAAAVASSSFSNISSVAQAV